MDAFAPLDPSAFLVEIADRWRRYEAQKICPDISPHDDMMVDGDASHYFASGHAAARLVLHAMLLADRPAFPTVLDLPCGGGRVTRHLCALLPDAQIFASDLDARKQDFVVRTFGALPFPPSSDFAVPPSRTFDLIFVGSLVTHLPADLYVKAVNYFLDALEGGGVLIMSMHGRRARAEALKATGLTALRHAAAVKLRLPVRGFAYVGSWRSRLRGIRYGGSFNSISWIARVIEKRPDARVLGLIEEGWDFQDVIFVQKRPISGSRPS